jgi:hypothetical protein
MIRLGQTKPNKMQDKQDFLKPIPALILIILS